VASVAIPAPATAENPRPFKARVTAQWDNVFAALPPSLGGAGLANFLGTGQVTHLGKAGQEGSLTLEEPVAPGVFPGSGSVTMTAANGDTLTFDFFGCLNAATGEGIGTFKFTGGTGRFANASGCGTFDALIDLSQRMAQDMTVILDGQIRY
jgi:hypothetical protein